MAKKKLQSTEFKESGKGIANPLLAIDNQVKKHKLSQLSKKQIEYYEELEAEIMYERDCTAETIRSAKAWRLTLKDQMAMVDSLFLDPRLSPWLRFQTFLQYESCFVIRDIYLYALRCAYTNTDNLFEFRLEVRRAFMKFKDTRGLMNKKELAYLSKLPKTLTIYRAMTIEEKERGCFGLSWALKKNIAVFFRDGYKMNFATSKMDKIIVELEISKNQVTAFFNSRKEFEIIYLHSR